MIATGTLAGGVLVSGIVWALLTATPAVRVALAGALVLLGLAGWALARIGSDRHRKSTRVDEKARSLGRLRDIEAMTEKHITADTERLGAGGAGTGVPLGRHTWTGQPLYGTWEWVQVWFMGPRSGKTSCACIPQILETRGPVLATSNKRDIVDLTRGPRTEAGHVWVHDVQDIIGEPAIWWWNPLTFVTDMERAEQLVGVFRSSTTSADARDDAYFGPAARETLARLFLAAAIAERPVTDVYAWANDPGGRNANLPNPAVLLDRHGWADQAQALASTMALTEKQRDGIYGGLRVWIGVLGNPKVLPWITDTGSSRPHFDPYTFVTSTDTLYAISKEGGGSARAITAALTVAVLTAAEETGARMPGGRLETPLLAVLDEVANVCRWNQLPDVYSHYGSRGINLVAFFQSWQQGAEAFGENGMWKLWGAANVRVAGGGLADDKLLPLLSRLLGDHDTVQRNRSSGGRGGGSTSRSLTRQRIFDESELAELPRARAVLSASLQRSTLLTLTHWSEKPYAEKVWQSRAHYEARAIAQGREIEETAPWKDAA
ncbi:type IV secretory system conjugative DNA transfer family protein [Agromyces sp. NPDC058126]|uniref:type IV secretory system conjugative DNA transfer family protein n=1 Tax=Agromyces sp. NPDC058126 TaxID=3346350 RepID=UPI0036D9DB4A